MFVINCRIIEPFSFGVGGGAAWRRGTRCVRGKSRPWKGLCAGQRVSWKNPVFDIVSSRINVCIYMYVYILYIYIYEYVCKGACVCVGRSRSFLIYTHKSKGIKIGAAADEKVRNNTTTCNIYYIMHYTYAAVRIHRRKYYVFANFRHINLSVCKTYTIHIIYRYKQVGIIGSYKYRIINRVDVIIILIIHIYIYIFIVIMIKTAVGLLLYTCTSLYNNMRLVL